MSLCYATPIMKINPKTGWLEGAKHRHSPHYAARPLDTTVDLIVIHHISLPPGEFGGQGIDAFFMGELESSEYPYYVDICDLTVSAHFLIRRTGEIIQYVSVHDAAWHAGESTFNERDRCNDFSVGIELEGTGEVPYESIQYEQLAALVVALMDYFPSMTPDRVVGHSDIAPGRKQDPGASFDWNLLRQKIQLLYNRRL